VWRERLGRATVGAKATGVARGTAEGGCGHRVKINSRIKIKVNIKINSNIKIKVKVNIKIKINIKIKVEGDGRGRPSYTCLPHWGNFYGVGAAVAQGLAGGGLQGLRHANGDRGQIVIAATYRKVFRLQAGIRFEECLLDLRGSHGK